MHHYCFEDGGSQMRSNVAPKAEGKTLMVIKEKGTSDLQWKGVNSANKLAEFGSTFLPQPPDKNQVQPTP